MSHPKSEHGLIRLYRRILDRIYEGGNIFQDKGRMRAYLLIASLKSDFQRYLDEEPENYETSGQ
jgi:hypothetical protein